MERLRAFWNRGWVAKAIVSIAGLLVICCVIGILVPRRTSAPTASQPTAAEAQLAQVAQATTPPEPTSAPAPTAVPATAAPSATPAPTDTPAPTAPPTETPSPTPLPEPVVLKGSGKVVTDPFMPPGAVNRVTFTHKGRRNFAVKSYRKDDEDLLVNEIGTYEGSRALLGGENVYFEIDADGPWTATIAPLGQDNSISAGIEGAGDTVSDLFLPSATGATPYTFSHDGERNFIVHLYCAGGDDSVANEIGAIEGQVVVHVADGPCFWEVQADGKWSVKPK